MRTLFFVSVICLVVLSQTIASDWIAFSQETETGFDENDPRSVAYSNSCVFAPRRSTGFDFDPIGIRSPSPYRIALPFSSPSRAYVATEPLTDRANGNTDGSWKPAPGPLMTPWGLKVSPDNVHPEYPRPQMVRAGWMNLNGLWDYAIRPKEESQPKKFDGKILVPFCPESQLSGVGKAVGPKNKLWYRRTFSGVKLQNGERLLLHFGAVDWHVIVWVNGKKVGEHKGGYDPFTFDITDALNATGENEIVLSVWDPTDTGSYPRGKQTLTPRGIWYMAVTGVWQTVWLEVVPQAYIRRLTIVPDVDNSSVQIKVQTSDPAANLTAHVKFKSVSLRDKTTEFAPPGGQGPANRLLSITLQKPLLWSPDAPYLYHIDVDLLDGKGKVVDRVSSYFGMRKITVGKAKDGHPRLLLNGKALFQYGPLDQGWWPDGLYTPPTDEALRYDIEVTKRLGFNMIRKHVTVEPARWYHWCDKLGVLVWQDMPSAMKNNAGEQVKADAPKDLVRDEEAAQQFETELKAMIDTLHNHPSIVMWVPFNEGWGQYDTKRIAAWVKKYDSSRLVNCPSGWTDRGAGDVLDIHNYPGPAIEIDKSGRAAVLGEFGGLGWPVPGHLWSDKKNWGYRTYFSREELNLEYQKLLKALRGPIAKGVAAAVYTQTTDVEGEVNGTMTYDRKVIKLDEKPARDLALALYKVPGGAIDLVAASDHKSHHWRMMTQKPGKAWASLDFDDSAWSKKVAPFQSGKNPFIRKGSPWKSGQIWLRKTFEIDSSPVNGLWLQVYQNVKDYEVFINGKSVGLFKDVRPTRRHYQHIYLDPKTVQLRKGINVIAVHAVKNAGPRAFDIGLYTIQAK